MNIIILGAPGAGKGTQAVKIVKLLKIPHISTGDIFRTNIKDGTVLGTLAKSYIDQGQLVPDEVVIDLVKDRIKQDDCKQGYLLDGFPRTLNQAQKLEKISEIDLVINLDIDLKLLLNRLTDRRVCNKCGASYSLVAKIDLLCDKCDGRLVQRVDDNEETVAKRLEVYVNQTKPLIAYYKAKGNLKDIEASYSIEKVFSKIESILNDNN